MLTDRPTDEQTEGNLHALVAHAKARCDKNDQCTQQKISLGICPVCLSLHCSREENGSLATHWAHSEDNDQTGWMPRLT